MFVVQFSVACVLFEWPALFYSCSYLLKCLLLVAAVCYSYVLSELCQTEEDYVKRLQFCLEVSSLSVDTEDQPITPLVSFHAFARTTTPM